MRRVVVALGLAAGLAVAPVAGSAQDPAPGVVQGRITAEDGQIPLAFALVELRFSGGSRTVLTDATGRYRFDDVAPGSVALRAQYLGHRPRGLEVIVPPGRVVTMDLGLTEEALPIAGLVVEADPLRVPDPDGRGPIRPVTAGVDVELALLEVTPGLAEAAIPPGGTTGDGGESPADPSHVLLMRGSTADLKLVLLDGAPVYTPFHLGGLLESFDAGTLGRAAHHVGGAPARYDGGLSYILDLETRTPNEEWSGYGAVDLLSARVGGEGGIGPASFLASARALHNGGPRLLDGAASPYGYVDGLVRAALPLGEGELSLTAFGNAEEVRLASDVSSLLPEAARWGNTALSARYAHRLGSADLRWTVARSRYDAELPLKIGETSEVNPVLARGETGRWRLALEGERGLGDGMLRFGATRDVLDLHLASRLLTREGVVRTDTRSEGRVVGGYLEVQRPLGDQVVGRLGGRIDHFDPGGVRTALRGSLAWALTPEAVMTLSAGRYHQLGRAAATDVESALVPEDLAGRDDPTPLEVPPFLEVGTGDHVVLGLDQRLAEVFELGLRGFVKRYQGVGGEERRLNTSGVDLRLQAIDGPRTGWIGYALSWSWETDGQEIGANQFLGRHLLTAGYRGPVTGPLGVELRVSFTDGLPFTEVDLGLSSEEGSPADDLDPVLDEEPALAGDADDFLRLDLELFAEWDTDRGRIRPYVKLMNALDERDALFYYFEPWRDQELTPLATRSVLPVIGIAWSF